MPPEKVINLEKARLERMPHSQGPVRCLGCRHEWHAVRPAGAVELECPKCGLLKGVPLGLFDRDGIGHLECPVDGNDLFNVLENGHIFCPHCGNEAPFSLAGDDDGKGSA